jgi:raffinose/stachyose/melibiose transport system substrate-binding protein
MVLHCGRNPGGSKCYDSRAPLLFGNHLGNIGTPGKQLYAPPAFDSNALRFQRPNMRPSWPALIALALAGLLAVAFGDRLRLATPSPDALRFAHTFTTESERAIIAAAIAEFEAAHPGVRIEQSILNSEVYQTLGWRLQFRGRQPPDIFFLWDGYKSGYAIEHEWALDLKPYLSAGFVGQFVPGTVREQDGGTWFLPQSVDICSLVWFNRNLFTEHGWQPPATFEEWLDLCARIRAQGILPLAQGNRDLWPMGNFGAELADQAIGPDRLNELFARGVEPTALDLAGLQGLAALREEGALDLPGVLAPGGIGSLGDIDAKVLFLSGRSAMHVLGSWFVADIEDARAKGELKFEVGVFPVPSAQGEQNVMGAVTTGYLVSRQTANPEAAVAFLELLLSPKYQAEFARLGGLSARTDADAFTTNPVTRQLHEFLAAAPLKVPPPDTAYRPEQAQIFYEICADLLTGKLELKDATTRWRNGKLALAGKGL